jgi:hypothetical protein
MVARPGQPTGSSRLCLSCHDGTIALGAMYGSNSSIEMQGGITTLPASRPSNLGGPGGTDLSNDHPISIPYTVELAQQNGQLKSPASISLATPEIRFEAGVTLQCTSCHNPHRDRYGKFLVVHANRSEDRESVRFSINKNFDLRPGVIVKELDLAKPIYFQTAKNGHFTNQNFSWEKPKALVF